MKSTEKMKNKRAEMDKNPRVEIGSVELDGDDFDHGKFRVTMWMDLDVLDVIRKYAREDGMKYQTWLNRFLREQFLSKGLSAVGLNDRVSELEMVVFSQMKKKR